MRDRREQLQSDKTSRPLSRGRYTHNKSIGNIIINSERLKVFLQGSKARQISNLATSIQPTLEVLARTIKQEKKNAPTLEPQNKQKVPVFANDMIFLYTKP